jgi:hypothetical protein
VSRITCTLTARELPQRVAEIRALGRAALLSVERRPAVAVLRFRAGPEARAELRRIVAAEARCCAFLHLDVEDGPDGLLLTIAATPGGEPVMHELVDAFAADASAG